MKKIILSIIGLSVLIACNNSGNPVVEKTAQVYGNCEQCEERIENAAKGNGVNTADWNVDSKLLTTQFDSTKTNLPEILKRISDAGHDNESYSANDYTYQDLPECCHYERKSQ